MQKFQILRGRLGVRRLCARIDSGARLLWEAQLFAPSPAAERPCHLENPLQAKGGYAFHDNNQGKKVHGAGAKSRLVKKLEGTEGP